KAFAPLAVIQFVQTVADAADKLSQFIADTFIFTQAEKDAVTQIGKENKVLQELADRLKAASREKQLLDAPTREARAKLQLQFELEDLGGSVEKLQTKLEETRKKVVDLRKRAEKQMEDQPLDPFAVPMGPVPTEDAANAMEELKQLEPEFTAL